jgi:CRP/FNR family cyclic AMP-dependent transcriptional regulator
MGDLAFSNLPTRVAKALLERAKPGPQGGPPFVDDNQGALAAMVGGSRENVNRCLGRWARAGVVSIAEGRISLLDPKRLRQSIDEELAKGHSPWAIE